MSDFGFLQGASRFSSATAAAAATTGTTNVKGSYQQIISATTFDYSAIGICVRILATGSGGAVNGLIDLAIGGAGSETIIVADMPVCCGTGRDWYSFRQIPLAIPSGTRLALRGQSDTSTRTVECALIGWASPLLGGSFGRCKTYGTDTSNSRGTTVSIVVPTSSTWTEIVSATSAPIKMLAIALTGPLLSDTLCELQLAIGAAGSETYLLSIPAVLLRTISDWAVGPEFAMFPCDLPSGVRIAARGANTAGTTQNLFVTLHGYY